MKARISVARHPRNLNLFIKPPESTDVKYHLRERYHYKPKDQARNHQVELTIQKPETWSGEQDSDWSLRDRIQQRLQILHEYLAQKFATRADSDQGPRAQKQRWNPGQGERP